MWCLIINRHVLRHSAKVHTKVCEFICRARFCEMFWCSGPSISGFFANGYTNIGISIESTNELDVEIWERFCIKLAVPEV